MYSYIPSSYRDRLAHIVSYRRFVVEFADKRAQ
jgi:hypothetical protein